MNTVAGRGDLLMEAIANCYKQWSIKFELLEVCYHETYLAKRCSSIEAGWSARSKTWFGDPLGYKKNGRHQSAPLFSGTGMVKPCESVSWC